MNVTDFLDETDRVFKRLGKDFQKHKKSFYSINNKKKRYIDQKSFKYSFK